MTSFYTELTGDDDTIRLLDILPEGNDEGLKCMLRNARLSDHPTYEALSYTWGDGIANCSILVDDTEVSIHANLANALHFLRQENTIRTLWTDALCINQTDPVEKACQVNMMTRIFTQCEHALLWLGCSRDSVDFGFADVKAAFELLEAFAMHGDGNASSKPVWPPTSLSTSSQRESAARAFRGLFFPGNPWWNRIWTVQEAALPAKKHFIWETLTVDFNVCHAAASAYVKNICVEEEETLRPELDHDTFSPPFAHMLGLAWTRDEALRSPLYTVRRWRGRFASDLRDKVYGLRGLLRSEDFSRTQCDYSLSAAEVYARLTLDIFDLTKGFDAVVGKGGEAYMTTGLPSWSLELAPDETHVYDGFWEQHNRYFQFNADGRGDKEDDFYECTSGGFNLRLTGICIDRVCQVDPGFRRDKNDWRNGAWETAMSDCVHILQRRRHLYDEFVARRGFERYKSGDERAPSAFWHTMMGGLMIRNQIVTRGVTPSDEALYTALESRGEENEATETITSMILNQTFFITEQGFIGFGPYGLEVGDSAWIMYGSRVPFLLRSSPDQSSHTFLGDGYVHGVMFGELANDSAAQWTELLLS